MLSTLSKCPKLVGISVLCASCLILLVHFLALVLKLSLPILGSLFYYVLHSKLGTALQNEPFLNFCMTNGHYSLSMLTVCLVAYVGWFYFNPDSFNPMDLGSYNWGDEIIPDASEREYICKAICKAICTLLYILHSIQWNLVYRFFLGWK